MTDTCTAKLVNDDDGQAVRLPEDFRMPGTEVRLRRVGRGMMLEPVERDTAAWWAKLDGYIDEPFMSEGRQQPPMSAARATFDE